VGGRRPAPKHPPFPSQECLHAAEALARTRASAARIFDCEILPLLSRALGAGWVAGPLLTPEGGRSGALGAAAAAAAAAALRPSAAAAAAVALHAARCALNLACASPALAAAAREAGAGDALAPYAYAHGQGSTPTGEPVGRGVALFTQPSRPASAVGGPGRGGPRHQQLDPRLVDAARAALLELGQLEGAGGVPQRAAAASIRKVGEGTRRGDEGWPGSRSRCARGLGGGGCRERGRNVQGGGRRTQGSRALSVSSCVRGNELNACPFSLPPHCAVL
jgi:hypothetical protein